MEITAKLNHLRIAPRKTRLVVDLIRGKKASAAQSILMFTVKRGAEPILKLLNSALANARHNFHLSQDNLYIKKITVDEGPKIKRWMPRARGSAYEIQKKTSHITIVLDEIEVGKKAEQKKIEEKKSAEIKPEAKAKTKKDGFKTQKPLKESFENISIGQAKIEKADKRIFRRKAF